MALISPAYWVPQETIKEAADTIRGWGLQPVIGPHTNILNMEAYAGTAIERTLKLRQPMYLETAAYGHMGRQSEVVEKTFTSRYHETKTIEVELFTWEKLDRVDDIKREFGIA